MSDYEIRYLRADGHVSLYYELMALNDEAVIVEAKRFALPECKTVEIWRRGERIYQGTNVHP